MTLPRHQLIPVRASEPSWQDTTANVLGPSSETEQKATAADTTLFLSTARRLVESCCFSHRMIILVDDLSI
jgi:hypothetical protein